MAGQIVCRGMYGNTTVLYIMEPWDIRRVYNNGMYILSSENTDILNEGAKSRLGYNVIDFFACQPTLCTQACILS